MQLDRRQFVKSLALASSAATGWPALAQQAGGLKISHQFPSGSLTEGDFLDRLCR